MVMTMGLDLIACRGTWVTDLPGNGDLNERLQDTINRGPGNLRHGLANALKDLIRGWVIRAMG